MASSERLSSYSGLRVSLHEDLMAIYKDYHHLFIQQLSTGEVTIKLLPWTCRSVINLAASSYFHVQPPRCPVDSRLHFPGGDLLQALGINPGMGVPQDKHGKCKGGDILTLRNAH